MAATPWPASLPPCFRASDYQEQMAPTTIRSEVDTGPAKVRRRFTRPITNIQASIVCDAQQVNDLRSFFTTTLAGGSLTFSYGPGPVTQQTETYRFVDPPVITLLVNRGPGSNYWTVSMNLERL